MDSDEDAPPPPPPSSPPPGGEEGTATKSKSEKFKALQNMLSSAPTMYSPSSKDGSAPPPSKSAHTEPENGEDVRKDDSPKLKHATRDRPRRKVRPPSRKGRSVGVANGVEEEQQGQDMGDSTLKEELPPDLPPPPPPTSELPSEVPDESPEVDETPLLLPLEAPPLPPPDLPLSVPGDQLDETPPQLQEDSPPPTGSKHPDNLSEGDENHVALYTQPAPHHLPSTEQRDHDVRVGNTPPIVPRDLPLQLSKESPSSSNSSSVSGQRQSPLVTSTERVVTTPPYGSPQTRAQESSHLETATTLPKETNPMPATPPVPSPLSNSPATPGSSQSKGIVMGSFSDRLKRIRENRSLKKSSPSLKGSTSQIGAVDHTKQAIATDIVTTSSSLTTSISTSPALSTHSTSSSLSYNDLTPSPSTFMQPATILEKSTQVLRSLSSDKTMEMTRETENENQSTTANISDRTVHSVYHENPEQPEAPKSPVPTASVPGRMVPGNEDTSVHEHSPTQVHKTSLVLDFQTEEDDEVPTAPPPPIPDLPPPPDDLQMDVDPEETEDNLETVVESKHKETTVTTKSSFRTTKRKKEWMRKSQELDSIMFDPLPLLVSTKDGQRPETLPEENESSQHTEEETPSLSNDDNVLHGSSESLPSLPDSPPPQLPDGPPPDLPSSFLPEGIDLEGEEGLISETLLIPLGDDEEESKNESTMDIMDDMPAVEVAVEISQSEPLSPSPMPPLDSVPPVESEQFPIAYSGEVKLRKPKRQANGGSPQPSPLYRRSAFDAMISVEPSSSEKREPKLSAEQRRSLALEASRKSNADTSSFLEQWNRETMPPSLIVSPEAEDKHSNSGIPNDENFKTSQESKGDTVGSNSPAVKGVKDIRLLSLQRVGLDRPRSIAGMSDLQINTIQDDESRRSLPPDADVFQAVQKSGSFSSTRDRNLTAVTKNKWKNTHLLAVDANTSLSASTGRLFSDKGSDRNQESGDGKAGKSNSWRALHSSSESLPLFKKSPKRWQETHGVSPLAATVNIAGGANHEEPGSTPQAYDDDSKNASQRNSHQEQSSSSEGNQGSNEDDPSHGVHENSHEYSREVTVPLRRNLKNLRIASVQADSRALDSPRPASLVLDRDILKTDPSKWSVDEVCQWLELIGLGAFRQAFRDRGVDGALLLQIDVQLFDELGVDSHEIREVFLAKIYELSNPRFSVGGMEDDFRLAVDDYTSEDWRKFQAAVSVLKSPVLGDSVELEPSAIGEYIHTEHIRSHSTPNIHKITQISSDEPGRTYTTPGNYFVFPSPIVNEDSPYPRDFPGSVPLAFAQRRWRRKSEPSSNQVIDTELDLNEISQEDRLAEWVAELPESGHGRSRAHTAPSRGATQIIRDLSPEEAKGSDFPQTLPRDLKLDDDKLSGQRDTAKETAKKPSKAAEISSPSKQTPKKEKRRSRQQSTSTAVSDSSFGPPGLVRLHMDTIQKGTYYKSFVADTSTTAEDLVKLALEKLDMDTQEHAGFCIVEKSAGENGQPVRKAMKPSQPILAVQSCWPQETGFCFELRRRRLPQQTPQKSPSAATPTAEQKDNDDQKHDQPLKQDETNHQKQLQGNVELEEKLNLLEKENSELTTKLQKLEHEQNTTTSEMQERLNASALEKQRLEEQVMILKSTTARSSPDVAPSDHDDENPAKVLEQVQTRYEVEMRSLNNELKEKERQQQEMDTAFNEMKREMATLEDKSEELRRTTRLLGEHNLQIHSLERDLAVKEEAIQRLRVQLEETQLEADQMIAYQKTIHTMEMTTKQQQEFTNRTVRDLKEQLSRLSIEKTQQEELSQAVRCERDRLLRDQQAKDSLIISLDADLNSYRTLCSASTTESSRVQALQRSLSVHEVAIASLRGEYQRQSGELKLAEEEVLRLRKSLANKEQQLFLLSEEPSRSSLFDLLSNLPPHSLATATISPLQSVPSEDQEVSVKDTESETQREESTIKVMSVPGAASVNGSVVVTVPKHLQGCGIEPRDRLLEINGTNVASKSHRETNKLLLQHCQQENTVKVVVARPVESQSPAIPPPPGGATGATSVEQQQTLNASLNAKLEFRSAEVEHWKQEYERIKDDLLRCSIAQQDKDSELKYLQAAVQDLKYQVDESERARSQLEDTGGKPSQINIDEIERSLKKKDKEIKKLKSTEKAMVAELKKLQQDKDKAVQVLRQQMIASEDLEQAMSNYTPSPDEGSLSRASRSELVKRVRSVEKEFSRHKAYLDQLLTLVIDQHPELLTMLGQVQSLRDQMEADADSWC